MRTDRLLWSKSQAQQWQEAIRARPDIDARAAAYARMLDINWRYFTRRPDLEQICYEMTAGKGIIL